MSIARFRAVPALALAAMLAIAPAAAAADGPTWVPSLKKAFEMAKERGHPILIWCVGDIDSAELADHQTLMNAK
ncbi:MAG: hypothetical protein ACYTG4_03025, partial [Planctomycetota bacterium]